MNNNTKKLSDAAAMAQFRLALIAPVIHGLYPDASRNAYYRRVTENPLTLPDGSVFRYSPKTLSKWVSLYQNGGIECRRNVPTRAPHVCCRIPPSKRSTG